MATIQGLTAPRMLEIEAAAIVAGVVDENMHLILTKHDGTTIDAGKVQGDGVPMGGTEGQIIIKTVDGSIWADNFATNVEQPVKNNTGATLTKGTAVFVSGATGDNVLVSKAQANSEGTSSKTLGLISKDIINGSTGNVITEGTLYGFNTSAATVGDPVWLSPTTAGGLIYGLANKPTVPNHMVYLGVVIRSHAVNGAIYVKVQNGYELDELHDVKITNPQPKQVIKRDPTNQFWLNEAASGGVVVSGSTPTDPSVGDGWFYDADGALFFRYFDGTNYAYVQANVPMSPTIEQRYFSPNYVINGAFDVWQRGTSLAHAGGGTGCDLWRSYTDSGSGTQSKDTSDYPSNVGQSYKFTTSSANTNWSIFQILETANTLQLAGKTVTLSMYLKSNASRTVKINWNYSTGIDTGWAGAWQTATATVKSVDTTWNRYSVTFTVPSNAKTLQFGIGTDTLLPSGATINVAGVQLELGTTPTDFRRNTNSYQAELAACQRSYWRFYNDNGSYGTIGFGRADGTTSIICPISYPVDMRATPSAIEWSGVGGQYAVANTISSLVIIRANKRQCSLYVGTSGLSTGSAYTFTFTTDASAYVGISAEL